MQFLDSRPAGSNPQAFAMLGQGINEAEQGIRQKGDNKALSEWAATGYKGPMPTLTSQAGMEMQQKYLMDQAFKQQEQQRLAADQRAFQAWQSSQSGPGIGRAPQMSQNEMISPALGNFNAQQPPMGSPQIQGQSPYGPQMTMPTFGSQRYLDLGDWMIQQQLGAQMPMSPLDTARKENLEANTFDTLNPIVPYKRYQPQLWANEKGEKVWVEPGETPPEGFTPYKPETEPSTNKLLARKMQQIETSMSKMEEKGLTGTPAYESMQKRWDELAKLSSASTTLNINPASPTERTALAQGASSIDALNNLKGLFDEVAGGAGVMAYPGPVRGPMTSIMGALEMAPAKKEEFRAATFAFKNAMVKAITGAQMSEPEAKRIMSQIPDIKDPPTRWRAKWRQSMQNIEEVQARRKQVLQQSGLAAPEMGGASASPSAGEPPAGSTKIIGGKTYTYRGNGQWEY